MRLWKYSTCTRLRWPLIPVTSMEGICLTVSGKMLILDEQPNQPTFTIAGKCFSKLIICRRYEISNEVINEGIEWVTTACGNELMHTDHHKLLTALATLSPGRRRTATSCGRGSTRLWEPCKRLPNRSTWNLLKVSLLNLPKLHSFCTCAALNRSQLKVCETVHESWHSPTKSTAEIVALHDAKQLVADALLGLPWVANG